MLLKELEIQGFKSFPDKVRITFDRGVTGVVGPNGSGKSNLSDAVRWVLGETSSRQLRSAGKMEDVIFGGARRRGAMGYASVRLTLDNADHALDLDADEEPRRGEQPPRPLGHPGGPQGDADDEDREERPLGDAADH